MGTLTLGKGVLTLTFAVVVIWVSVRLLISAWRISRNSEITHIRNDGVHLTMVVGGFVGIICGVALALSPWVVVP